MNNRLREESLTRTAHRILCDYLKEKGNKLSEDHSEALRILVCAMSAYVLGTVTGRLAYPLATGLGKTSAIKAWIKALHVNQITDVGIAVAASKVEAIAEIKLDLMEMGVPADKIAVLHSYEFNPKKAKEGKDGYASVPSTDIDIADKQFILVTHQRIKNCPESLELFNTYQGKPRDLLIWDESLLTSKPTAIVTNWLKGEAALFDAVWSCKEGSIEKKTLEYLKECNSIIDRHLEDKTDGDAPVLIDLPKVTPELLNEMSLLLDRQTRHGDSSKMLLDICTEQVRATKLNAGGILSYEVSVPSELENILILDASYPVRELMKIDNTIKDISKEYNLGLKVPLDKIKTFSNVTINYMKAAGGRNAMEKAFGDTKVINDIIKVIKETPENEKVLVFVYKTKSVDMRRKLLRSMRNRGLDINRVSVATWGQETSSNEWSDHKHVILAGIMQQSRQQLEAAYCGQMNDLKAEVNYQRHIKPLALSESTHLAYQAASRGHCRLVDNGQAGEMTLWLIHFDEGIKDELSKVMPDAKWNVWNGDYSKAKEAALNEVEEVIKGYLQKMPETELKISSRKIKADVNGSVYAARTWTRALRKVSSDVGWLVEGQSLVRAEAIFS